MNTEILTADEIRTVGLNALMDALGPSGFIRFFREFTNGYGDYTRDRDAILGNQSVDNLVREIQAMRDQRAEPDTPA
jgi:hypothetical protein